MVVAESVVVTELEFFDIVYDIVLVGNSCEPPSTSFCFSIASDFSITWDYSFYDSDITSAINVFIRTPSGDVVVVSLLENV